MSAVPTLMFHTIAGNKVVSPFIVGRFIGCSYKALKQCHAIRWWSFDILVNLIVHVWRCASFGDILTIHKAQNLRICLSACLSATYFHTVVI